MSVKKVAVGNWCGWVGESGSALWDVLSESEGWGCLLWRQCRCVEECDWSGVDWWVE